MMDDLISRQAAIEALYSVLFDDDLKPTIVTAKQADTIMDSIRWLPSAQTEDCDTCKHGYFGDEQCNNCRVRYPSHYERRTDEPNNKTDR